MTDYELREQVKRLEGQVAQLVKRACEHSGHDWSTWHRLHGPEVGQLQDIRSCLLCGKGERKLPPLPSAPEAGVKRDGQAELARQAPSVKTEADRKGAT